MDKSDILQELTRLKEAGGATHQDLERIIESNRGKPRGAPEKLDLHGAILGDFYILTDRLGASKNRAKGLLAGQYCCDESTIRRALSKWDKNRNKWAVITQNVPSGVLIAVVKAVQGWPSPYASGIHTATVNGKANPVRLHLKGSLIHWHVLTNTQIAKYEKSLRVLGRKPLGGGNKSKEK